MFATGPRRRKGLEFVCVFGHDGFPMSISIVGSAMRARGLAAQRVEARIGCKILNTMTALGMPDSEMIG